MKVISKHNEKAVYSTNYKPLFAYNSIVKLLESKGIDCYSHGKSRNTNTYYIEACDKNDTKSFEIRLSDHTKYQENDSEGSYTNVYSDTFEANIICNDGFRNAKKEILNFIQENELAQ